MLSFSLHQICSTSCPQFLSKSHQYPPVLNKRELSSNPLNSPPTSNSIATKAMWLPLPIGRRHNAHSADLSKLPPCLPRWDLAQGYFWLHLPPVCPPFITMQGHLSFLTSSMPFLNHCQLTLLEEENLNCKHQIGRETFRNYPIQRGCLHT